MNILVIVFAHADVAVVMYNAIEIARTISKISIACCNHKKSVKFILTSPP